jgi:hypothetical protein
VPAFYKCIGDYGEENMQKIFDNNPEKADRIFNIGTYSIGPH